MDAERSEAIYLRRIVKREWSASRNDWEEVTRAFDSEVDIYSETYRNLDNGEITFHKEGPHPRSELAWLQ